jgi:hypothetical protein
MGQEHWEAFHRRVLHEPELQAQLLGIEDKDLFVERTVELGKKLGYEIEAVDIRTAMTVLAKEWIERAAHQ